MDNMPPGLAERSQTGGGTSNLSSFRRPSSTRPVSTSSNLDGSLSHFQTVVVIVHKDENGYGMKVSGDNPVYVQSVKEGGAAEKAGLQCGDIIIKVNGENVTQSTHVQVVSLIRASTHVELTVHQNSRNQSSRASIAGMTSPSSHSRMLHSQSSSGVRSGERITGPQPVDVEKLRQFETQRVHTFRLMLEKEQLFVDTLRSKLAKCTDPQSGSKIQQDLNGAIRRVSTLQEELKNSIGQIEHSYALSQLISPVNPFPIHTILEGECVDEIPPPLPKRNRSFHSLNSRRSPIGAGPSWPPRCNNFHVPSNTDAASLSNTSLGGVGDQGPFQVSPHTIPLGHHRTKSNPDPLGPQSQSLNMSPAEASKKLIAAESLQDIYKRSKNHPGSCDVDSPHESPSGTPPPPYRDDGNLVDDDVQLRLNAEQTPDVSPLRGSIGPHASTPILQSIISMEEDDTSDQELGHLEDHGPFKSLRKLWQHHAHLAVFMNYLMCNSDPSSLLFYLVTDLYKEGNGKEMKKWAYEIHSSFLVPGAPLRLNNVDENFAREIDDVLLKESDKEEILRRIFWKARVKAKEELNEQLADFQQKLTAGLGTLFGPSDAALDESIHDKNKELKIVESILIPKMESYMEDIEKDNVDMRRFTTAAALGTILGKIFGLRGPRASSILDRCPTFISKDKSLKAKLLIGKSRKLTVRGHQFVAHQYYTVTYCNHCQLIIWGIGPQGYQCTNCNLNVHRHNCVRVVEESCPGPITKKDRGDNRISKLMEKIRPEREARKKPTSLHVNQSDRGKRHVEDKDESIGASDIDVTGDRPMTGLRTAEKRPDTVRESEEKTHNEDDVRGEDNFCRDIMFERKNSLPSSVPPKNSHSATKSKNSSTSINRSESYRERIPQKKIREKRKTSDPNLSKTSDVDLDAQGLSYTTNSGSSSNSSLSARSLESPSTPLDMVTATQQQKFQEAVTVTLTANNTLPALGDSDTEAEPDPPDWTKGVDENVLKSLSSREKKRQEVINELFHTEKSHVTRLKVLDQIFLKPMQENQILPADQLHLLFQNLEEMLDIHSRFNSVMKAKKKESPLVGDISDIILAMFDGAEGDNFQRAAAVFCAKQQIALEQLKERRKKDPKLNSFLTEAEGNAMCRRLQLKDMLPTVMQRLTKYPLLFENLAKYTQSYPEEEKSLLKAVERSKAILNHVNQAVKAAEDHQRLEEIQKRLDKSAFEKIDHPVTYEFKNLDLRTHKLIHEGSLSWRIGNRQKPIDIYVLLLHDIIILLQKQDEKFVLKFYNMSTSSLLSPIVKVSSVLVRHNAVDKSALYLVNTSQINAQIYDLVASSPSERIKCDKRIRTRGIESKMLRRKSLSFDKSPVIRAERPQRRCSLAYGFLPYLSDRSTVAYHSQKSQLDRMYKEDKKDGNQTVFGTEVKERRRSLVQRWLRHISEAADAYKNKDHFNKNRRLDLNMSSPQSPPDSGAPDDPSGKNAEFDDTNDNEASRRNNELETSGTSQDGSESNQSNDSSQNSGTGTTPQTSLPSPGQTNAGDQGKKSVESSPSHRATIEPLRLSTVENSLVEPSEVVVSQESVLTAEHVLTQLEQLRLKSELVKKAVTDHQQSLAEMLHVPKGEIETIAEMLTEPSIHKETDELIFGAFYHANRLVAALNDSLDVTEEEAVAFMSEVHPGCSPMCSRQKLLLTRFQAHKLQEISVCLNFQIAVLSEKFKEQDEERERLRKELQRSRELIHYFHELHKKLPKSEACPLLPEDVAQESTSFVPILETFTASSSSSVPLQPGGFSDDSASSDNASTNT